MVAKHYSISNSFMFKDAVISMISYFLQNPYLFEFYLEQCLEVFQERWRHFIFVRQETVFNTNILLQHWFSNQKSTNRY